MFWSVVDSKSEGFLLICCKLFCNPCFMGEELVQSVAGDLLSSRVIVLCGLLFFSLFDCFLICRRFYWWQSVISTLQQPHSMHLLSNYVLGWVGICDWFKWCFIRCLVCNKMPRGYSKQVDDLNYLGSGSTFGASLQLILFFLFLLIWRCGSAEGFGINSNGVLVSMLVVIHYKYVHLFSCSTHLWISSLPNY